MQNLAGIRFRTHVTTDLRNEPVWIDQARGAPGVPQTGHRTRPVMETIHGTSRRTGRASSPRRYDEGRPEAPFVVALPARISGG